MKIQNNNSSEKTEPLMLAERTTYAPLTHLLGINFFDATNQLFDNSFCKKLVSQAKSACVKTVSAIASSYLYFYEKGREDKNEIVRLREEMHRYSKEEEFFIFYDLLVDVLEQQLLLQLFTGKESKGKKFLQTVSNQLLLDHQELILNLFKINLANGFLNLIKEAKSTSSNNFVLMDILTFFCSKIAGVLKRKKLKKISYEYKENKAKYYQQTLSNESLKNPDEKTLSFIQELKLLYQEDDSWNSLEIESCENQLFEHLCKTQIWQEECKLEYLENLRQFSMSEKKLKNIFMEVAGLVIEVFFPAKGLLLEDIETVDSSSYTPNIALDGVDLPLKSLISYKIYDGIQEILADFFYASYNVLEQGANEDDFKWKKIAPFIEEEKIDFIMQALLSMGIEYSKSLQAQPETIQWISEKLHKILPTKNKIELETTQEIFQQNLNQIKLINWFLNSFQALLNADDEHVKVFVSFIERACRNISLAAFSQILIDLQKDEINWEKVFYALPPFIKNECKELMQKNSIVQECLQTVQAIQKSDPRAEIQKYWKGEQFLALIDVISERFVEAMGGKNIYPLSRAFSSLFLFLQKPLDDLLLDYCRSKELNKKIREAIPAFMIQLGNELEKETFTHVSFVNWMKKTIQFILQKNLVNIVEANFSKNTHGYAAYFFKELQKACKKAFSQNTRHVQEELQEASAIWKTLQRIATEIEEIQEKIKTCLQAFEDSSAEDIKDVIRFNRHITIIVEKIRVLEESDLTIESISQILSLTAAQAYFQKELEVLQGKTGIHEKKNVINAILTLYKTIDEKHVEYKIVQDNFDACIKSFQILSQDLLSLFDLKIFDSWKLPLVLRKKIQQKMEIFANQEMPRILFQHLNVIILPLLDYEKNLDKIKNTLKKSHETLVEFAQVVSKEIVTQLPHSVKDYRELAFIILQKMGEKNASEHRIDQMTLALKIQLMWVGKDKLTAIHLEPLLEKLIVEKVNRQRVSESLVEKINSLDKFYTNKAGLFVNTLEVFLEDSLSIYVISPSVVEKAFQNNQKQVVIRNIHSMLMSRGKLAFQSQDCVRAYNTISGFTTERENLLTEEISEELSSTVVEPMRMIWITLEELGYIISQAVFTTENAQEICRDQIEDILKNPNEIFQENREFLEKQIESILLHLFSKIVEYPFEDKIDHFFKIISTRLSRNESADIISHELIQFLGREFVDLAFDNLHAHPTLKEFLLDKISEKLNIYLSPLLHVMIEGDSQERALIQNKDSEFLYPLCDALSSDIVNLLTKKENSEKITNLLLKDFSAKEVRIKACLLEALEIFSTDKFHLMHLIVKKLIKNLLVQKCNHILQKHANYLAINSTDLLIDALFNDLINDLNYIKDAPNKLSEHFSEGLAQKIMGSFGIESSEELYGVHNFYKEKVYLLLLKELKQQINKRCTQIHQSSVILNNLNQPKEFPNLKPHLEKQVSELAEMLSIKLAGFFPQLILKTKENTLVNVHLLFRRICKELQKKGYMYTANVLSERRDCVKDEQIRTFMQQAQIQSAYKQAIPYAKNFFSIPLKKWSEHLMQVGKSHFTPKLAKVTLQLIAQHLNFIKKAKQKSGRKAISHQDFLDVAATALHPALPQQQIQFVKTITSIEKCLKLKLETNKKFLLDKKLSLLVSREKEGLETLSASSIQKAIQESCDFTLEALQIGYIRHNENSLKKIIIRESSILNKKKKEFAYLPLSKDFLLLAFPKGIDSLLFVPEEHRKKVWDLLEKKVLPLLFPLLTKLLLDPKNINKMVLGVIEDTKKFFDKEPSLSSKPIYTQNPQNNIPFFNEPLEAIISEILEIFPLPSLVTTSLIDSTTKKIKPAVLQKITNLLLQRLTSNLMEEGLEKALLKILQSSQENTTEEKLASIQERIFIASRQAVDAAIVFYVKSQWLECQHFLDSLIEKYVGSPGVQLKKWLDITFEFIFFKVIKSILSFILFPSLKNAIKEIIYRMIALDKNLQTLFSLYSDIPLDQPKTEDHITYHENLIYQWIDSMREKLAKIPVNTGAWEVD